MFPADAGMNRKRIEVKDEQGYVPRRRGDEPFWIQQGYGRRPGTLGDVLKKLRNSISFCMFVNISYWLQHIQAGPGIHILFSVNPETENLFIPCRKSLSRLATSSMVEDHAQGAYERNGVSAQRNDHSSDVTHYVTFQYNSPVDGRRSSLER